ncbi:hypothetical protein ABZ379_22005 [Streptomyces canus]|uniref:hypothetical protein n=1 Tax=Streptomyces canus TaxID=58343 RepID=UPI0033E8EE18
MNGSTLQKTAADCAEDLPGARCRADDGRRTRLEHPLGPGWEVFKVGDKVFMLMTEVQLPSCRASCTRCVTRTPPKT